MTDVRLVLGGDKRSMLRALSIHADPPLLDPSLLVSYVYWQQFFSDEIRPRYVYRSYVVDSGAFSAFTVGKVIDLNAYIEHCVRVLRDPKCHEVFTLDVIGDWRASMRNTERMWEAGVPAVPVYHVGEPEHVLLAMAGNYPKIALGGAVGMPVRSKILWAQQCFARVWPKRVHGLGFGSADSVMAVPFDSVDATSWSLRPSRFGQWMAYDKGRGKDSLRMLRRDVNMRAEADYYLRIERAAKMKWARKLAECEPVPRMKEPA